MSVILHSAHYIAQTTVTNCKSGTDDGSCLTNLPQIAADSSAISAFLSILFAVLAAVAVIIIVVQGIKFSLSQGDPQKAADARKAIIYAVVGLAISLSAEAIVRLLIGRL